MSDKMANIKEVMRRMNALTKSSEHPTDEKLRQEGEDQEQKDDALSQEEIDKAPVSGNMNDGEKKPDKGESSPVKEREKDKIDAGDGYGTKTVDAPGSHPTDEKLDEDVAKSAEFGALGKEALASLKAIQGMLKGSDEDTYKEETQPDAKPDVEAGKMKSDEEVTPPKGKKDEEKKDKEEKEDEEKKEKKEKKDEDKELSPEDEKAAGKEAAEKVAKNLINLNRQNNAAKGYKAAEAALRQLSSSGYKEGAMVAQALMGGLTPEDIEAAATAEGMGDEIGDLMPMEELAVPDTSVVTVDQLIPIAEAIVKGKEPEGEEEEEIKRLVDAVLSASGEPAEEEVEEEIPSIDEVLDEEPEEDESEEGSEEDVSALEEKIARAYAKKALEYGKRSKASRKGSGKNKPK